MAIVDRDATASDLDPRPVAVEQFDWIEATFTPTRTDDLREGAVPVGYRCKWQALWVIEEGSYEGDWAMMPAYETGFSHWVPLRDLSDAVATEAPDGGR